MIGLRSRARFRFGRPSYKKERVSVITECRKATLIRRLIKHLYVLATGRTAHNGGRIRVHAFAGVVALDYGKSFADDNVGVVFRIAGQTTAKPTTSWRGGSV